MRVTGIVANLAVDDIGSAQAFYRDYLGLDVEGFNLGWVAHYQSPDGRAHIQLVTGDATAPHDSVVSVHVGADVDEAYAEAQRRGYEIVHPLIDEPWGVRRFFVRAPDGRFHDVAAQLSLNQPLLTRGIATADVDGDGRLDYAVANQWGTSYFYRNESNNKSAFIGIRLRLPVGDGMSQTRVCRKGRATLPSRAAQRTSQPSMRPPRTPREQRVVRQRRYLSDPRGRASRRVTSGAPA